MVLVQNTVGKIAGKIERSFCQQQAFDTLMKLLLL